MNDTTQMTFTIDTSRWSMPQRIKLLELVEGIDATLQTGPASNTASHYEVPADAGDDLGEPSGWNQEAYLEVLKKLLRHHHVQVAVIFEAIKGGTGYVSRERVYELGHYDADRSLKGFTRPVNRFTADAIEAGLLDDDVEDLLAPDYDPEVTGYQRARGFRVPLDVVRMAEKWREEGVQA